MKKATIQIAVDAEKFRAIETYIKKKDIALADELEDAIQKLYEKHVPAAVRAYIEGCADAPSTARPRQSRPRSMAGKV